MLPTTSTSSTGLHRKKRGPVLFKRILFLLFSAALAFATASTPVAVSSISCSAGVCTVTTGTAHNIPSNNPGFALQGGPAADQLAGTAITVPTSTTFTFNSSTATTCSSSCGTAQPGKNFVIFGNPFAFALGLQSVTACVYNYISTPLPIAGKTSACASALTASGDNANLLAAENGALASGAWIETTVTLNLASSDTRAQIEQELQRVQFAAQLQIAAGIQPGRDTATFCDAVGCNQ